MSIEMLKELQNKRKFCMSLQQKCDRATEAYIARTMGYHGGLDPKDRKEMFAKATKLRRAVERGQGGDDNAHVAALVGLIMTAKQARTGFDESRADIEKDMRRRARELPVWPWVEAINGFGDLGLAIIVAEAGDLSNYPTVAKLWKRLGLAVLAGVRQGGLSKSASADEWIIHGYNRQRRAAIWTIADSLLWAQWRGEKEDVPAHAIGPYGTVYTEAKTRYLDREWTKAHAEAAARRYMTKRLMRDLWVAWRANDEHH